MRNEFSKSIACHQDKDDRIWVVVGDLGYGIWDEARKKHPERFINAGAAEQAMVDISIGLALEHKIPIVYTIAPFLLYRPFESLRTYINHEQIPVILVASGRDKEYAHDGISHWSHDAPQILNQLPAIRQYWPQNATEIPALVAKTIASHQPTFISLKR